MKLVDAVERVFLSFSSNKFKTLMSGLGIIIGVKTVSPRTGNGVWIKFRDEEFTAMITAVTAAKEPDLSDSIDKGRFLMESDRSSIVIGSSIANSMFKMPLNPGMRVNLKNKDDEPGKEFTIAGILKEKNLTSAFEGDPNMEIYTTHQALKDLIDVNNYSYSQILVVVEDQNRIEITSQKVDDTLRRLHRDEAYSVFMMKSILEGISQALIMVKYALGGIGAISLMVGGIGIALLIPSLGDFPMAIRWTSIAIGLVFVVLTPTIAGVYPANKAARLDPVEALRAE